MTNHSIVWNHSNHQTVLFIRKTPDIIILTKAKHGELRFPYTNTAYLTVCSSLLATRSLHLHGRLNILFQVNIRAFLDIKPGSDCHFFGIRLNRHKTAVNTEISARR